MHSLSKCSNQNSIIIIIIIIIVVIVVVVVVVVVVIIIIMFTRKLARNSPGNLFFSIKLYGI